jgi:ATP-binding cassette subfamily C (CFTR/MRP) protein 1
VDIHLACQYASLAATRWLGVRLELLGNLVILSSAILAVLAREWGTTSAGPVSFF